MPTGINTSDPNRRIVLWAKYPQPHPSRSVLPVRHFRFTAEVKEKLRRCVEVDDEVGIGKENIFEGAGHETVWMFELVTKDEAREKFKRD
jgi:hypothetical protein